jgi:hypothetical protein
MRVSLRAQIFAAAAALASAAGAASAEERPLGERLTVAADKFGLSEADVAAIRAAGGEFACPGDGSDGARLNAWLIGDRQVLTNAHAIVEGEERPGRPYLRQPVRDCVFVSFHDLGARRPPSYAVNLNGLGAVLRPGARAPVDPTGSIGGDVVRLRLDRPVRDGVPLVIDPTPVAKGDTLLLVSRVPTTHQTEALPGDDLLIERCTVTSLDPETKNYSRGGLTDCNGAPGMSAGVLFARRDGQMVAKGFLVALEYVRPRGSKEERLVAAHNLLFDAKFTAWLAGDCAFWPAALRISFCGVKRW